MVMTYFLFKKKKVQHLNFFFLNIFSVIYLDLYIVLVKLFFSLPTNHLTLLKTARITLFSFYLQSAVARIVSSNSKFCHPTHKLLVQTGIFFFFLLFGFQNRLCVYCVYIEQCKVELKVHTIYITYSVGSMHFSAS